MESEADDILAVSAAWAFSRKGGGFPAPSRSNLLQWKGMGWSVGPAGPGLQNRVELKCCFFSVLSGWHTLTPSV